MAAKMSSWTSRCNHLWSRTRTMGADSLRLVVAIVYKQGGDTARDVMVAQARLTNGVAVSFLQADREVGLLRYWGLVGYLREKDVGQSWPPVAKRLLYGSQQETDGNNNNDSDPQKETAGTTKKKRIVGRVAFMITSAQRVELSERLGYEADHIKMLKPVEASLILEHNLSPSDDEKLKGLVQAYNDELVRQHQEAKLDAEKRVDDDESITVSPTTTSSTTTMTGTPLETETKSEEKYKIFPLELVGSQRYDPDGEYRFVDNDSEESTSSSDGTEWYEVVENRVSDGSEIPVALYRNEDEAQLCLELKEEFAVRHAREKEGSPQVATTYIIRKTIK